MIDVRTFKDDVARIVVEVVNNEKVFQWRMTVEYHDPARGRIHGKWCSVYNGVYRVGEYAYATDYWNGTLPVETPFRIIETKESV